ncbi:MAG: hypothetical protein IJU14_04285 [Clostridia bacterium]|nr:hypothetical protein [Clostridia bacterium]
MVAETLTVLSLPYPNRDNRTVRVYVPKHEEGEKLPVVYMTDGQNLFEDDTVKFGCWYTRESVREEQENSGKGVIIVGIHNDEGGDMQRTRELIPKAIGEPITPPDMPEEIKKQMTPEGEIFADFIVNTVMPTVEKQFPVKTGRENTAFCGSSCGGMMAFFIAVNYPDVFCISGVFSPVFFFFRQDDLKKWVQSKLQENMPYLYIYTGGGDELEKQIWQSVEQTYDNILIECYPVDKLNEIIMPEYRHHESAWEPIFKDFLHTFLF